MLVFLYTIHYVLLIIIYFNLTFRTSPSGAVARNVGERGFNGNMGMDLRDAYGNGGGFDNIELHGGYEPATTAAAVGATIWGTDIRAETICEVFRDFLNNFTTGGRHGGKSTYMVLLEELYKLVYCS